MVGQLESRTRWTLGVVRQIHLGEGHRNAVRAAFVMNDDCFRTKSERRSDAFQEENRKQVSLRDVTKRPSLSVQSPDAYLLVDLLDLGWFDIW